MRFLLALFLVLFAACAPATRPGTPMPTLDPSMPEFEVTDEPTSAQAPLASPIVVPLDLTVEAAMDRTVAAFRAEGLRVDQVDADARRVKSAGVLAEQVAAEDPPSATVQAEHFYNATVEPADRGSRVILSVSTRNHRRTSAGNETTPESELQECQRTDAAGGAAAFGRCERQMAKVQARLDSLARRVHAGSR